MLEGFYTAASGVFMQERVLGVLTNNLTNVKTPGYRAERVVSTTFQTELERRERGNRGPIGPGAPIRVVEEVESDLAESSLSETGRPFDFALVGEGYFNVQTEDGTQYMTRNGQFERDEDGYLVLPGAGFVLDSKGKKIELDTANFTVNRDGEIFSARGRRLGKLMITVPGQDDEGNPIKPKKFTNGLYTVEDFDENEEVEIGGFRVEQGALERANIDVNREYTMVMEAQRALQACAAALKIVDTMNQKTANQIASL